MPNTIAEPNGWQAWRGDFANRPQFRATWETDVDLQGDSIAGVASIRLLPTLNRNQIVSFEQPVLHYERIGLVVWVKASSIAVTDKVFVGVTWIAYIGEGVVSGSVHAPYFNAQLDAVDTWQRLSFIVSPSDGGLPAQAQAGKIIVGKSNTAFTVNVGLAEFRPMTPFDPMPSNAPPTSLLVPTSRTLYLSDYLEAPSGVSIEAAAEAVVEVG